MLDCTYRVQIPHRAGQLAKVASAIAEVEGLIGDIVTVRDRLRAAAIGVPR